MAQISSGIMTTGVALAIGFQRLCVVFVARVTDVDGAAASEQLSVSGIACRQNAIEHIGAKRHKFDEICRRTDTHDIPRLAFR